VSKQPESGVTAAIMAGEAPPRLKASNYPEPYRTMMTGRVKRPLGDLFGLTSFGVNHVIMQAGASSSLLHRHSVQDEFVYVIEGELVLLHEHGEVVLTVGMCAGFAHQGRAHQLVNRSPAPAVYLEVGDRQPGDGVDYPRDDLVAVRGEAGWRFAHKNGVLYPD
jgi:uncharacterized cupin superfamily protein